MDLDRVPNRSFYKYRCQYCDFENTRKRMPESKSGVPVTKLGDYGRNATPTPVIFTEADAMFTSYTTAFVAASGSEPAKIQDAQNKIGDAHFAQGMLISITTTSGTNDGSYTIADRGASLGEIRLSSSDSLTDEAAAVAGLVTIYRRTYKPGTMEGCPFCGSKNSRKQGGT